MVNPKTVKIPSKIPPRANGRLPHQRRKGRTERRMQILSRDEFTCLKCGEPYPEYNLEVDHIIPLHQGGPDNVSNLQTLCKSCHAAKSLTEAAGRRLKY